MIDVVLEIWEVKVFLIEGSYFLEESFKYIFLFILFYF